MQFIMEDLQQLTPHVQRRSLNLATFLDSLAPTLLKYGSCSARRVWSPNLKAPIENTLIKRK